MNGEKDEDARKILLPLLTFLRELCTEEQIEELADFSQRLAVVSAMLATNSNKRSVLAEHLYESNLHVRSLEEMGCVIDRCMPLLEEEGMVFRGRLTEDGRYYAERHLQMLGEG